MEVRKTGAQKVNKQKENPVCKYRVFNMQKMGLEPTRYCYHMDLNHARLPIPPLLRTNSILSIFHRNVNRFRASYRKYFRSFRWWKMSRHKCRFRYAQLHNLRPFLQDQLVRNLSVRGSLFPGKCSVRQWQ